MKKRVRLAIVTLLDCWGAPGLSYALDKRWATGWWSPAARNR